MELPGQDNSLMIGGDNFSGLDGLDILFDGWNFFLAPTGPTLLASDDETMSYITSPRFDDVADCTHCGTDEEGAGRLSCNVEKNVNYEIRSRRMPNHPASQPGVSDALRATMTHTAKRNEPHSTSEEDSTQHGLATKHKESATDHGWIVDADVNTELRGYIAHDSEGIAPILTSIRHLVDQLESELISHPITAHNTVSRRKQKQSMATSKIRYLVDRLESNLISNANTAHNSNPRRKRKRCTSTSSSTKKQKTVHMRATRAFLKRDTSSEPCEYVWRRGRYGRCWVREKAMGEREEVDGNYLLSHDIDLSVEVRANADWLPIVLRWNDEKKVFEGHEEIGPRKLTVDGTVMKDLLCDVGGEHLGRVSRDN